ncbi:hypothetical protein G7Y79_00005g016850 [Physcia stellaris]|nr:hypothetical protein G7Y79_00005g016850 [Physcia stellaris]
MSSTSSAPTATSTNPGNADFKSLGCYKDGADKAVSPFLFRTTSDTMTVDTCLTYCKDKGTTYAGIEYRRECYCGNIIASDATANANGCTLTCMGKTTEYCGGSFQMNVYKLIKASSPSTTSKSSASSTAKSSSTLSTSTISLYQTTPSATGTPTSGFYSLGCYAEPSGPTPKPWAQILASDNMSPEACISAAQAKLTANPPVTYRVLGLEDEYGAGGG